MIELSPEDFSRVIPLVEHPLLGIEAKSIASGNSPGWIFVDAYEAPQVALIWSIGLEGFVLAGNPNLDGFVQSLDRYVRAVITPRAQEIGWSWFEVSGCSPGWDTAIARAFSDRRLEKETILINRLQKPLMPESRVLPNGVALHRLDAAFFTKPPCEDLSFIQDKIQLFWPDLDSFLSSGIGFCATQDSALAAVCMTGFNIDQVHMPDIETLEPYRRHGLGYQVGHAFITHCLENGLEPHWGCMKENKPSWALAESLGLSSVMEFLVFYFPLLDK